MGQPEQADSPERSIRSIHGQSFERGPLRSQWRDADGQLRDRRTSAAKHDSLVHGADALRMYAHHLEDWKTGDARVDAR